MSAGWAAAAQVASELGGAVLSHVLNRSASQEAAGQSRDYGYQMAMLNYNAQKEFAQNGIRWRVADAKAAGLHPLAALGASPLGFSPSFGAVGSSSSWEDFSDVGQAIGRFGQNIGRAIEAKATEKERAANAAYEAEARKLDLENKQLQNDSLRQKIIDNALASAQALRTQPGQPPAMQQVIPTGRDGRTLPGQGDAHTSLFEVKPPEVMASHPSTPFAEAGSHPETLWTRTADGGYAPMRGQAVQQALEDDIIGSIRYNVRNGLGSALSDQRYAPPRDYLPNKGRDSDWYWMYDNINGSWHPVRHSWPTSRKVNRSLGGFF